MNTIKTGGLIAQVRKEKELTQKDLAEALHVSTQAVSKWERGLSCPDIALLEPLAEALGLTVSELLAGQRGEEPGEELVRDSLRFGERQLRPKIRRWRGLFILAAALLLAVLAGLGYVWVRDNTGLLPQKETVVTPLELTDRERGLLHAVAGGHIYLYDVSLGDEIDSWTLQWELWTHEGMEQSWKMAWMGDLRRFPPSRHELLAFSFSFGSEQSTDGMTYSYDFLGATGHGEIDEIPYMMENRAMTGCLPKETVVDPEEGIVLLYSSFDSVDGFYHMLNALPPEEEGAVFLVLKLYCK